MNSGGTLQFYLDRAAQARAEGEAAALAHVRERCRRSEAAWRQLADRAQRAGAMREKEQQRKAAIAAPNADDSFPAG